MQNITQITARGTSAKNGASIVQYLQSASSYYMNAKGQKRCAASWWGEGTSALGLQGKEVDMKDMDRLAEGFSPDGKTALCKNAGAKAKKVAVINSETGEQRVGKDGKPLWKWEGGHKVGYDLTFSPPKHFSILYARATPEMQDKLLAALDRSVDASLSYLEREVETRRGAQGVDVIGIKGLVVSRHTHFSARSTIDESGTEVWDPDVHQHCLVYGVAEGMDGKWGTFDAKALFRLRATTQALQQLQLDAELRALGFGTEKIVERDLDDERTGRVWLGINGISADECLEASKRRSQILDHMTKHGGSAQAANFATRRAKEEPSYDVLTGMWKDEFEASKALHPDVLSVDELLGRQTIGTRSTDVEIMEDLHKTEAVWTKHELIGRLALENIGRMDAAEVLAEAEKFLIRNDLAIINPERQQGPEETWSRNPSKVHREERYSALHIVEQEKASMARALDRKGDAANGIEKTDVQKAILQYQKEKGFTLSDEQVSAIHHLTNGDGVGVMTGFAGAGKTSAIGAAVAAWEADGRIVIGFSEGWNAATKLSDEACIKSVSSMSLLQQLDSGKLQLTDKHVLIGDEAGMMSTNHVARVQAHIDRAGAKLVLQGDSNQLSPVGQGQAFRQLSESLGDAKLTEIRRQKDAEDKKTSEAFYESFEQKKGERSRAEQLDIGKRIFSRLKERKHVHEFDSQKDAAEALACDWMASKFTVDERIVIAGTNNEAALLNRAIRDERKAAGHISAEEISFTARDGKSATELQLSRGDRVRFGKKDKNIGVINGSVGTVVGFQRLRPEGGQAPDEAGWKVKVKLTSGEEISFNSAKFKHVAHAYAATVHKSQGQGEPDVFHLAGSGQMDNALQLVAFTRMKQKYRLYGAISDLEVLEKQGKFGERRMKMNALEEGVREIRMGRSVDDAPLPEKHVRTPRKSVSEQHRNADKRGQDQARTNLQRSLDKSKEMLRALAEKLGVKAQQKAQETVKTPEQLKTRNKVLLR